MGSTYVPLDSWIYPALDRLAALGYLPKYVQALRPLTRLACAQLTLQAQEETGYPEIKSESTRVVAELRREFAIELANLDGASNVGIQLESAYVGATQIMGMPLADSYHFAQTIYDNYGRPYGQGFNSVVGASVRTEAGPLAFYLRGEYQHSASIAPYSPSTAQAIATLDNMPLNSVPTFYGQNQFNTIEAYAALNMHNWQMSFGQQSLYWGPDADGSLMLSNNAEAMPMLRVGHITPYQLPGPLAWLGMIRNEAFIGRVGGQYYLRGAYPEFPLVGNGYQLVNPQPYMWGDKLGLKMTPNFEIGVTLTVMWAGEGRPANLSSWLHTWNSHGNAQPVDPGKRFTGFNFSYRIQLPITSSPPGTRVSTCRKFPSCIGWISASKGFIPIFQTIPASALTTSTSAMSKAGVTMANSWEAGSAARAMAYRPGAPIGSRQKRKFRSAIADNITIPSCWVAAGSTTPPLRLTGC
jgi:hypothetical protein